MWLEFIAAFAVFFASHAIPVRPPVRPWLEARLGRGGFTLAYSVLSLAILTWLIVAAGRAPYVPLWAPAPWQAHLALALMLGACVIVTVAVGAPNPFSFGGARHHLYDPARPGIVRLTRHPILAALALWALAHLVANGDLAHAILFGLFGMFSLIGGRLIDRRKRREMGPRWSALQSRPRAAPRPGIALGLRVLAGGALFMALLHLHPPVIGVDPMAMAGL